MKYSNNIHNGILRLYGVDYKSTAHTPTEPGAQQLGDAENEDIPVIVLRLVIVVSLIAGIGISFVVFCKR